MVLPNAHPAYRAVPANDSNGNVQSEGNSSVACHVESVVLNSSPNAPYAFSFPFKSII